MKKKTRVFRGWFPKEWARCPEAVMAGIIMNDREKSDGDKQVKITVEVYR